MSITFPGAKEPPKKKTSRDLNHEILFGFNRDPYMGVSKHRGKPPKWMVKIRENPIRIDGFPCFFWKHPYITLVYGRIPHIIFRSSSSPTNTLNNPNGGPWLFMDLAWYAYHPQAQHSWKGEGQV